MSKYIVVDLETTGNSPKKGDKIIQFAAVVIEGGKIIDTYSSLVNPERNIPIFIEELTGINDEMVKSAPVFSEIAPKVMELLKGAYFVAHNVLFDLSFLQEELFQAGYEGFYGPSLDTVELTRILNPTADGYKLSDLAQAYGLSHDRPHQADSDAYVTAELLLLLLKKLESLPNKTLKLLVGLAGGLKGDLKTLFDETLIRKQAYLEYLDESLEEFHGLIIKKFPHQSDLNTVQFIHSFPSSEEEKISLFQKSFSSGIEKRMGQYRMMDEVMVSFDKGKHLAIEAGTGVGKSLAYLVPAAYFSNKHGTPVVISTHTIQLQEQLLQKEIPLLMKMLPFDTKVVLLKGRQHYLSLEKFMYSLNEAFDNYDTTLTKMQILVWLTETNSGDRDELNLSSGGQLYWNKIKSDRSLFSSKINWKDRDFYTRAKDQAVNANIVITNHSLLLSNMENPSTVLPPYEYVVIDEGHHFEKTAGRYLGTSLDYLNLRMTLSQFGTFEQRQLFYKLEQILEQINVDTDGIIRASELNELMFNISLENDELFKVALILAKRKYSINRSSTKRVQFSMENRTHSMEWQALSNSGERLFFALKDLIAAIERRLQILQSVDSRLNHIQRGVLEELLTYVTELEEIRSSLRTFIFEDPELVKWLEVDLRAPQNATTFHAQPHAIGEKLAKRFFSLKKSVIITSATLTVNNSFTYLFKGLGMETSTKSIQVPSPFHYDKQVQLMVCEDLPEINSVPMDEYVASITEHIISIAEATKGRMLILFTAHEMLKKTYELVKESGFLEDFVIMAQGITSGSKTRLTKNFQRYEKSILLGTSSFWEGVDIPGEDLTCLVIVRLPFTPPDEPLTNAKCQQIENEGGNAFHDFSLPEAILRFRQGFGRLIRTKNDRGIVVVFDRRIISANYGKYFLDSIPKVSIFKGNIDSVTDRIHKWLS
ncbi:MULTISPECIES: ATP-dependent DNA helicase DinG [unclassified Bacillus (in: firmicutes)]|uniref:ATP-dependent DNA helicase DinG n=1 Tax=unclassified Bacillus (in: firmicutes) TaxID=185979 RepID=UPI0008E75C6B|nr:MULTISPECIES: ATP-dependent DNA helicase DinG [unclassified Bacillus (in: firmicutes)]SFA98817.1 ATP-dependent DNA helicase DinG [Bacillus sp. UNCCL13]SFQ81307.1 ATP-dependent DNA helicase DinG [Bacillus sp. cl95]